ncbi:MAG: ferrous iron transport protein A [Eubacteriales bacterium]|jgi:Fe2+ transport system protein FeoA|nr:ferrous iron transport protein A [Clostridiales bacterium]
MTLYDAPVGGCYRVVAIYSKPSLKLRLSALGLTKGAQVTVLSRGRSAVVFRVRGARYAAAKGAASCVILSQTRR